MQVVPYQDPQLPVGAPYAGGTIRNVEYRVLDHGGRGPEMIHTPEMKHARSSGTASLARPTLEPTAPRFIRFPPPCRQAPPPWGSTLFAHFFDQTKVLNFFYETLQFPRGRTFFFLKTPRPPGLNTFSSPVVTSPPGPVRGYAPSGPSAPYGAAPYSNAPYGPPAPYGGAPNPSYGPPSTAVRPGSLRSSCLCVFFRPCACVGSSHRCRLATDVDGSPRSPRHPSRFPISGVFFWAQSAQQPHFLAD